MKKLLALLLSCALMMTAFVSCGDDDDDNRSKRSKTRSSSSYENDDDDDDDNKETENDDKIIDDDDDDNDDEKKPTKEDPTEENTEEDTTEPADDEDMKDFAGKWEAIEATVSGQTITAEEKPALRGLMQIELFDDGTGIAASSTDDDEEELKWKISGKGKADITDEDDDTITFTLDGNTIKAEYTDDDGGDIAIVLEKVKRFTKPEDVTEPTTEPSTEKPTKKPSTPQGAEELIGTWDSSDSNESIQRIIFNSSGKMTMSVSGEDLIAVNGKNVSVAGKDYTNDVKFDGKTFTIKSSGVEFITMEKITEGKGYDGDYVIKSGIVYDALNSPDNTLYGLDLTLSIDNNKTYMNVVDIVDYSVKGSKIKFSNFPSSLSAGMSSSEQDFEISGDTLKLKDGLKTLSFKRSK